MLSPVITHWSPLINFLIQNYLVTSTSICIIWNKNIEWELETSSTVHVPPFIQVWPDGLTESFGRDIYNFTAKEEKLRRDGVTYTNLVEKLIVAIEHTHCEAFIAFQEDIPTFARSFRNASILSIWRSLRSKFLFAYRKDLQTEEYFDDYLFQDQAHIMVIEADTYNSTVFDLKTNKFTGPFSDNPKELYLLNRYDALERSFVWEKDWLYPNKFKDLEGREIILGIFDYRPFTVVDYEMMPQTRDYDAANPRGTVHVDGTEVRPIITYCEIYNCSLQADTSEKLEWGLIYPNTTGDGLFGLIVDRKSHMGLGAMYLWYSDYIYLDLTVFLGRSGVTCMVPAPTRLTSWTLPLKPFQFTLWLGVVACLVLETVSLLVTHRMEQITAAEEGKEYQSWFSSFQFGYITTLKLFVSQGTDYIVNSTSVRTVLLSCYMIDIIITSIYGGGLAAILTLPTLGEAADSLERLYQHGLRWTATSDDWVMSISMVKDDPLIVTLLKRYFVTSLDEMRQMAKTENLGFIVERLSFGHFGNTDFLTKESLNRLKIMVDDIYFQYSTAFVQRLWAFLPKYNELLYNWHSSGLDKFWEWKVTAKYLNINDQNQIQASMVTRVDAGPVELDMANFAGLILVWFAGTVFSIFVFTVELMYYKLMTTRKSVHVF